MNIIKEGSKGSDVKLVQQKLNLQVDGVFGPITKEAVKEFQRNNGLSADGVVGKDTWKKLTDLPQKSVRVINEIIVHCSATPEGKAFTTSDVKKWHLARGFSDIGYHYVVYLDGSIHPGRSVDKVGAHCTNHNSKSIGVCYIGGLAKDGKTPKDTRTDAQKESLLKLLKDLKSLYPEASIRGHRDFANKACPSFDATKEYSTLNAK